MNSGYIFKLIYFLTVVMTSCPFQALIMSLYNFFFSCFSIKRQEWTWSLRIRRWGQESWRSGWWDSRNWWAGWSSHHKTPSGALLPYWSGLDAFICPLPLRNYTPEDILLSSSSLSSCNFSSCVCHHHSQLTFFPFPSYSFFLLRFL